MDVARLARLFICTLGLAFIAACDNDNGNTGTGVQKPHGDTCRNTAVPNQFLVKWKDGSYSREFSTNRETFNREFFEKHADEIAFAEHDFVVRMPQPVINTETHTLRAMSFSDDWGQVRVGAPDVWTRGILGEGVTVAVIDTGVDTSHSQLTFQIARNMSELPNGKDDDGNGYIDDIEGYDFYGKSGRMFDDGDHGSHVAGIIAADHSMGDVFGMAPKAKILPLRFIHVDKNGNSYGLISDAVEAIMYALSRNVDVINASWGGSSHCSGILRDAISVVSNQGVFFVSASGNGDAYFRAMDIGVNPQYPASFEFDNHIVVGASGPNDFMTSFSNYSTRLVHLLAPGLDIYSTVSNDRTDYLDGTSMAAPFVSGALALLKSHRPAASSATIKEALFTSVDTSEYYPVLTSGRLNVKKAIEKLELLTQ